MPYSIAAEVILEDSRAGNTGTKYYNGVNKTVSASTGMIRLLHFHVADLLPTVLLARLLSCWV